MSGAEEGTAATDKITDRCGIKKEKVLEGEQKHHLPFYLFPPFTDRKSHCEPSRCPLFSEFLLRVSACVCLRVTLEKSCTHSDENLRAAVGHLDVLVVHEAAHDSDVGVALGGAHPRSLLHLAPHAARPVFAPPRVMG